MLGWLWYPIERLKQLVYFGMATLGIILIGFESRFIWTYLMTKLLSSSTGFMQELVTFLSGIPYLFLIQIAFVVIVIILAFMFG